MTPATPIKVVPVTLTMNGAFVVTRWHIMRIRGEKNAINVYIKNGYETILSFVLLFSFCKFRTEKYFHVSYATKF